MTNQQTTSKAAAAQTPFKPWCASCALKENDRIFGDFKALSNVDQRLELCFMEKQLEGLEATYQAKAAYYMRPEKAPEPTQEGFKPSVKKAMSAQNESLKEMLEKDKALGSGSCTVAELAHYMSQNGHPIGRNQLYAWMRERDYITRNSLHQKYLPTQWAIDTKIMFIERVPRTTFMGQATITKELPVLRISTLGRYYFTLLMLIENGKMV